MTPSLVLHIPHSSCFIPKTYKDDFLLEEQDLQLEILKMTDWFTDELFKRPDSARIVFPVSRLVLDPERFLDDDAEIMAAQGMGVVYERTSDGRPLRVRPDVNRRQELVSTFYIPHHQRLTAAVDESLRDHDRVLVLDCHSFPSHPLPYEQDQQADRAEICLGSNGFHTPTWLVDAAATQFKSLGLSVAINRPFAGALVPAKHYQQDARVHALMIEVNRKTYMNEEVGTPGPHFVRIASAIRKVMTVLNEREMREI